MADGRGREMWAHTASLLAWIGNCHAGKNAFDPRQFNPYTKRASGPVTPLTKEETSMTLRALFMPKTRRKRT